MLLTQLSAKDVILRYGLSRSRLTALSKGNLHAAAGCTAGRADRIVALLRVDRLERRRRGASLSDPQALTSWMADSAGTNEYGIRAWARAFA